MFVVHQRCMLGFRKNMLRRITRVQNSLSLPLRLRYQSTTNVMKNGNVEIITRPPQLVRLAVVGSAVTLATPIFTVAGADISYFIHSLILSSYRYLSYLVSSVTKNSGWSISEKCYSCCNRWECLNIILSLYYSNCDGLCRFNLPIRIE